MSASGEKTVPFYISCDVRKIIGGKRPLWQARRLESTLVGAGSTAENAIRDLQRQFNRTQKKAAPC